jgi:hypothetical protein
MRSQDRGDAPNAWRKDEALGNVDHLVIAALREEADLAPIGHDELGPRAITDGGSCGRDGLAIDERQSGVAPDRLHDSGALDHELLRVRKIDERAAAASFSVLAVDALGGCD